MKPILVASDHAGFQLKEVVKKHLKKQKVAFTDLGTDSSDSTDFPKYGFKAAEKIASGEHEKGIIICGTGIGISIAANRYKNVRAALCTSTEMAELSRKHNDANLLALGGRTTKPKVAEQIINTWLGTKFEGARHEKRVNMMTHVPIAEEQLAKVDPDIFRVVEKEKARQNDTLVLIASENYTSMAVMEAAGSVLTNKYAEGYPGNRYYAGCVNVDEAEKLAIERAKKLFNASFANVQPHSGSQANMAVLLSLLQPGETILGLNLSHGGHLTHGSKASFSGKIYNSHSYSVNDETQMFDYDEILSLAKKVKPKLVITGASAYPRTIHFDKFRNICDEVGAFLMADIAHIAGLIAADLHPSPMAHAHVVTSTTHKTLRGPRGGMILTNHKEIADKIDKNIFPGTQGGPLMHAIAAKAVGLKEALEPSFRDYQKQIVTNARVLAETLVNQGFELVSGGTDNHLMLIDLRSKNVTGVEAERALEACGIIANKNTIPFDPQKPSVASGVRLGTPAATTRGMGEDEMRIVAKLVAEAIGCNGNKKAMAKIKSEVDILCRRFPVYK